uniref:Spermatogenesis-associated protein 20-like TRX domain-containing protein n=1 Tax=Chenopodium quinoa TaxID=63459 RepID=A0A803L9N1_CHEQI
GSSALSLSHRLSLCPTDEVEFGFPSSSACSLSCFEELRGMLCISHVEENDVSSHGLEFLVGQLENPFGILNFVKGLKDEGNILYKQNQIGSAIAKYSLALKILSFASVCSDEDILLFSSIAVSLNLNLGACFIKVKDYDRVGQLCSAVLCFDTTNVKAYFRRAIAALELNKPSLAFMDLAQALKLDPKNTEFQQKLKEVISLLGWTPVFIDEVLAVTRDNDRFRDYAHLGKEDNSKKLRKKGKRKVEDGRGDGNVRRCTGVTDNTNMDKNVDGNSLDLEAESDMSYFHLTPTMYGVISKGRKVQYYCSSQKNFITIRVANPLRKMDRGETQEGSTPMELSHPPVEGHDRCEMTPILIQVDPTIGMASQDSSCEATSTLLPLPSVSSPLQASVHPTTSSSENLLGFVSSPRPRLSGSKRIASGPIGCHVMEVESFESEEVAKLLNDWFVSIKVDREERPDVDKVYMTYVQALYGGGGWPLTVFLSPDLKPLMGGTYFPPDDKYGRPGFKTVLRKVKEAWDSKRDMLVKSGSFAIEQLSEALSTKATLDKLPDNLPQEALDLCAEQLSGTYDSVNGGFGSAPKFPRPVEIQLMLYHSKKMKNTGKPGKANEVPHFEKMLYDQGQLVNVYLDTFAITRDSQYSDIARDVLDYLRRDMIGEEGEIYSAEDADSAETEGAARKKEGAFYVWSSAEIEDILKEHATLFKEHYYIKPTGNCDLSRISDPHNEFRGKNVLIERRSTEALAKKHGMSIEQYLDILGMCRKKLFDVRSKRPHPHLDDKVIVSWNGLVISSFARASKILKGEPDGHKHYFPVAGTDDELFMDKEGGGYFNTPGEDPSVLLRVKEDHDGAEPSGNSVAAINLTRLASIFSDSQSDRYRKNADLLLATFQTRLKDMPMAVPLMCCAADMLDVPSRKQVVLVGHKSSTAFDSMLAAAHAVYDLNKTVIHIDPSDPEEIKFWEAINTKIANMAKGSFSEDKVVGLVCQNFSCKPPVSDPASLQALLSKEK